jgi:hypothetical protein
MKLKSKIFRFGGLAIRRLKPYKMFSLPDDHRETFPYKLVYMCGREGIGYLNASLVSIYRTWDKLPEVVIVSDGTPLSKFEKDVIRWPRKIEVISWEEAAVHFAMEGNTDLCQYARNLVYGKKLISLLYLARQFPFLYSDTDVLWYSSPEEPALDGPVPYIKMGEDVGKGFYSNEMLAALGEEKCRVHTPYNAGLMYLNGDFSVYPKWTALCRYLSIHRSGLPGPEFSEQTAFAILNNYFNGRSWWTPDEVLIRTDDEYTLGYTPKSSPGIRARHYVHTRRTAFWRDFIYMCMKKRNKKRYNYDQKILTDLKKEPEQAERY